MRLCFVVMPIGKDDAYRTYLNRYENLIKPAIEGLQIRGERAFDAVRADFISSTGSINRSVLRHLYEADIVVADLTDLNANVFYELGVRHALRHGTILMALKNTALPFDVGDLRVVYYEDKLGGEKAAIPEIQRLLQALLDSEADDSPVFQAVPALAAPAARASAEAEARISALEAESRELRAKLAVAEQVSLNFRDSFSTFEQTVRSMLDNLSPAERKTAESAVANAALTRSDSPRRTLALPGVIDPRLLFVLMPFRPGMEWVYNTIRIAAEPLNLKVLRADQFAGPGLITDQILEAITRSRVVVADITGRNPNVLYEIGIAHSVGKDVILIAESGETLPFDIAGMRVLFYESSVDGAGELGQALRSSLEAVLAK